jgi:zinc transport system ATP-binding protein
MTATTSVAVELAHISVIYGNHAVLEDITFSVAAGQFVAIIGPNGAGKTTCLKVILGLIPPSSGTVRLFGLEPAETIKKRHAIGYVPQRSVLERNLPFSVMDVVLLGRVGAMGPLKWFSKKDRADAEKNLQRVELLDCADRPINELSGGQLQRVMIARALSCGDPRLLILDEPTIGVDIPHQLGLYEVLVNLKKEMGLTILVVSHDLAMIGNYADEMVCLNRTMHVHGNPCEVLHSHGVETAYRCEYDRLFGAGKGGHPC